MLFFLFRTSAVVLLLTLGLAVAAVWRGRDLPDADVLAYHDRDAGVRLLDVGRGLSPSVTVTGPEVETVFWSPDGRWLTFAEQTDTVGYDIVIADSIGRRVATLPDIFYGAQYSPAWSPTGDQFAFTGRRNSVDNISLYSIPTGTLRDVTTLDNALEYAPLWSPDGSLLLYTALFANENRSGIYLVAPEGGPARTVYEGVAYYYQPAWSPDGQRIALTTLNDINARDLRIFDLITGAFTRPDDSAHTNNLNPAWHGDYLAWVARPIGGDVEFRVIDTATDALLTVVQSDLVYFDWLPTAEPYLLTLDGGDLMLIDVLDDRTRPLTTGLHAETANVDGVAWAADGSWLAVASAHGSGWDIFRVDVPSGAVTQLTFTGDSRLPNRRPSAAPTSNP